MPTRVAINGFGRIGRLEEALRRPQLLDPALYETAELFFG